MGSRVGQAGSQVRGCCGHPTRGGGSWWRVEVRLLMGMGVGWEEPRSLQMRAM